MIHLVSSKGEAVHTPLKEVIGMARLRKEKTPEEMVIRLFQAIAASNYAEVDITEWDLCSLNGVEAPAENDLWNGLL